MPEIHRFESLPSTMQKAVELAQAGSPSGTVVTAREQTAGQGRFGRSWYSEPEAGLYMSQILRLKLHTGSLPLVTLALGLATADAIIDVADIAPDLRWPNDVLIHGKKCAGILVQLHDEALIAGIGVNINQTEFPAELGGTATSLRLCARRSFDIDRVLQRLISRIEEHLENLVMNGRESVLRAFAQASSYVSGRRVVVEQNGVEMRGITDGMDPQGFLFLRQDNGQRTLILAGGVRPA